MTAILSWPQSVIVNISEESQYLSSPSRRHDVPQPGRYWPNAASIGPISVWFWHIMADVFHAGDTVWLVLVSLLWGVTNPLIKRGGQGIEKVKKEGRIQQLVAEFLFLVFNWKVSHLFIEAWTKYLPFKTVSYNCFHDKNCLDIKQTSIVCFPEVP